MAFPAPVACRRRPRGRRRRSIEAPRLAGGGTSARSFVSHGLRVSPELSRELAYPLRRALEVLVFALAVRGVLVIFDPFRNGRLDLRTFMPLVEGGNRDERRAGGDG